MRVLLICMPFAALDRPALGLSVLKPAVQAAGHECDIVYLNLDFAALLGSSEYWAVSRRLPFSALAGEWVFAEALWGSACEQRGDYIADVLRPWRVDEDCLEALQEARTLAVPFIEETLASIDWYEYDVVGFSSFGPQNVASLALARGIKERCPELVLLMGGHNWTGATGVALHAHFPFVDFVFMGEADDSLPRLLDLLEEGETEVAIPGVSPGGEDSMGTPIQLESLPLPDHNDFFGQRACSGLPPVSLVAPLETSRGCWWAARNGGCTFCALNDGERRYRSKSADRILLELRELERLWPESVLEIVDNVVPDRFLVDVLPRLADQPLRRGISFKVRPDVTPEQLMMIRRAGGNLLCGIESLSDHLLESMNKGVTALQAVRLLKWCNALGIRVDWNMLWGITGEDPQDYRSQADMIASLDHLEPPDAFTPVTLERFSALWRQALAKGPRPQPAPAYRYVYPLCPSQIDEFAFFFQSTHVPSLRAGLQISRLADRVKAWREARRPGRLVAAYKSEGNVVLRDSRRGAQAKHVALSSDKALVFSACADPVTVDELVVRVHVESAGAVSELDVERMLSELQDEGLIVRSGRWCLNLATTATQA